MRVVLMPIGTSLVTNYTSPHGERIDETAVARATENQRQAIKRELKEYYCNLRGASAVSNAYASRSARPDPHPAEISSLYGFWKKKWEHVSDPAAVDVRLVLLHSPGNMGEICSRLLEELISDKHYFPAANITWEIQRQELTGLDPASAAGFSSALNILVECIIEETKNHEVPVAINLSGGYKALGPYVTMMAMASAKPIEVFYLFERSPDIIILPSYPFAFDLVQWRDWRGMLLPFTRSGLLTPAQLRDFFSVLDGTRVQGLLECDKHGNYTLNSVGRVLQEQYEHGGRSVLSEHGQGYLLLDGFSDKRLSRYLQSKCIPRWQHLAVGDQIPETVEHGRGHVQRLLELASQFLLASGVSLTDLQRFVLIAAIWLHDLGHSGIDFRFSGPEGPVVYTGDPDSKKRFFAVGDPDTVRLYHNFLSWELIRAEQEFLFQGVSEVFPDPSEQKRMIESVALASLYHRRAMPVSVQIGTVFPIKKTCCAVTKGIREFGNEAVIEGFAQVAALLRVIDGAENQQERSGSEAMYDVTNWVINRQRAALERYREDRGHVNKHPVDDLITFKKEQPGHFTKHRLIKHVLVAREYEHSDDESHVYGRKSESNAEWPVVGVYLVASEYCLSGEHIKEVMTSIVNGFLEEFLLVSEVLDFRIALFFVGQLADPAKQLQICIKVDQGKKPEDWEYELKPRRR